MSDTTTGSDSDAQSGFPAYSDLTDAARYSLVWIGISLVIILALWRSLPCCSKNTVTYEDMVVKGRRQTVETTVSVKRRLNVLLPLKILTVLFHEMSHAIVGMATCGTVAYISVNKGEGGETHFKPPPARQPAYRPTLAAGYLGSCLIGCALLGAGFDALASKWAALALVGYLFIAFVICCSVRAKSTIGYNKDLITYWISSFCGSGSSLQDRLKFITKRREKLDKYRAEQSKRHEEAIALCEKIAAQHKEAIGGDDIVADRLRLKRMEDELDQVYEDKMVSLELIISIALFISIGCILPGWLIADSVGLRFVIMFIGLFSAVYAVQDIYDDGVKHRHMPGSDAHNYASLLVTFNPTVEPSQVGWDEEVGEYQWKLTCPRCLKHTGKSAGGLSPAMELFWCEDQLERCCLCS